jgi:hypothetical protein
MKKGGVRMTRRGFRETKGLLSGDVYVVGRSLRHSGVPEPVNAAPDASRKGKAATDDGSGKTAGGDATTSVATAAVRGTCAEVADSMAKKAKGTPKVKQVKTPEEQCGESGKDMKKPQDTNTLWEMKMDLGGGPELPSSGRGFVEAVNAKMDLVTLAQIQLKSRDEKLSGRLLEQLLKIAYQDGGETRGESGQISGWIVPRPERE